MSIETADPEVTIGAPERPVQDGPAKIEPGPHRDFVEKVAGTLRYADDWGFPGTLHGVVVRAQLPRPASFRSTPVRRPQCAACAR